MAVIFKLGRMFCPFMGSKGREHLLIVLLLGITISLEFSYVVKASIGVFCYFSFFFLFWDFHGFL